MTGTPASERNAGGEQHQDAEQQHALDYGDESTVIVTPAGQITSRDVNQDDSDTGRRKNGQKPPAMD
jgi:hypothetical protein